MLEVMKGISEELGKIKNSPTQDAVHQLKLKVDEVILEMEDAFIGKTAPETEEKPKAPAEEEQKPEEQAPAEEVEEKPAEETE